MGKGSRQRPTNKSTFDDNFDRIFGVKDVKHGRDDRGCADRNQSSGSDGDEGQPGVCDNDGPVGEAGALS